MAKYNCEVFGLVSYSLEISYHELYEVEEQLLAQLQEVLEESGAVHLDFWGYGDSLRIQCSFSDFDVGALESVCQEIAALLPQDAHARFVCVDKQLRALQVFYVQSGQCEGVSIDIDVTLGKS